MSRFRLALLSRRFWPGVGAAETRLSQLACGLADRDCQVTVVSARRFPKWPTQVDYHDFPVERVGPTPDGFWRQRQSRLAISNWVNNHLDEFDLFYVLGMHEEAATVIRAVGGRRTVVLAPLRTGRYGDCCWQVECASRRSIKSACLRSDALLASSPAMRSELEAAGYPREKIHDAWLGVELPDPNSMPLRLLARGTLAEANSMLFLAVQTPLAVCTTRLGNDSGWETLLEAWSKVVNSHATAKLWLISEPVSRGPVQWKISALQLENCVQLIGGADSIEAFVAAADLLVAPSPHGSHLALLEAMATGLPAVAADNALNRWVLGEGQAGLLATPGEPEALAEAIIRVLDDAQLASALGDAGRQRALEQFSLAKMLDDHLTLFQTLLETRREFVP